MYSNPIAAEKMFAATISFLVHIQYACRLATISNVEIISLPKIYSLLVYLFLS
jgi:hypothetical protein